MTDDDRFNALRAYYPNASKADWTLIQAGERIQIVKKDPTKGGVLKLGTEIVTDQHKTLAALLGAAPITLNIIEELFSNKVNTPACQAKIKQIIPSYGQKINRNVALTHQVWNSTAETLHLTPPPVIKMHEKSTTESFNHAESSEQPFLAL